MSQELPSVGNAAQAIATALKDKPYALIGGAALVLLGSTRVVESVDLVVPQGTTSAVRKLLRDRPDLFDVEPRTLHTTFRGARPLRIEILTPPFLFREAFDADTPTQGVHGVHILKPGLLLNATCGSIMGRMRAQDKTADAEDIRFLLAYLCANKVVIRRSEIPNATSSFVQWYMEEYGSRELVEGLARLVRNN